MLWVPNWERIPQTKAWRPDYDCCFSCRSLQGDSPVELAKQLKDLVKQAAQVGSPLHTVERLIFDWVLGIGDAATEMFLRGQGDGNLGTICVTESGEPLVRSDEPVERPLRTVFGHHTIHAFVSPGPHENIALRPVEGVPDHKRFPRVSCRLRAAAAS
jgi:hypothetical protein